ncbi:MAG TPA: alpha-L-fucosidase, partial [Microbacterium sp.]|nr:alpha-L-fucosidase [Microbacterium sp.]
PPYQIDGNFGLVSGVLEALVQSHRLGRIDLLPALPAEMGTGRVRGLIARPGIRLDLDWCDGEPVALTLEAVKPSTAGPVTIAHGSRRAVIDVPARGVIEVPLPLPLPPTTPIDRSTA